MKKTFISNLQSRRLTKMIKRHAETSAEMNQRIALEEFATILKNRGIKEYHGHNFTLIIK